MNIKTIQNILSFHEKYWEKHRKEMRRFKAAYETNFWDEQGISPYKDTQLQVQVSEGYNFIESYMASLFAKHPAVVLKSGLQNKGNAAKAGFIANEFLEKSRHEIEAASRMALIYTHSFLKLIPAVSDVLLQKVLPVAIPPWEVILDYDASRWDLQKFVGHIYYMTVEEADDRFGKKDWSGMSKVSTEYFSKGSIEDYETPSSTFEYIKIIEMYDMAEDQLLFYSPNWKENKILEKSPVGIPFKSWDGKSAIPIVPFYFNHIPDVPLEGYSAMKRVYDQIFEMNIIRSFQANAVRKASRQYLVKKGSIDADQMAQITAGIDGIFIEIEEENMDGIIKPLPQNPTPPELDLYYAHVTADKDKGSIMAPFTRGEATKVSATEAAALAAYTSSEIGRLARERDAVIENLTKSYFQVLGLYLSEGDTSLIYINNKLQSVTVEDIMGDFQVYASDSSSTPMSEALIKGQLLNNIPTLIDLGVPRELVLDEVVRVLNLPETFKADAIKQYMAKQVAAQAPATPQDIPNVQGLQGIPQPMPTATQVAGNPSAQSIAPLLPGGLR